MIYIIDGYNVMHCKQYKFPKDGTFEKQRSFFVELVSHYAIIRKKKVQIVFDGAGELSERQTKKDGLTLLYTQKNQTADQAILDIIESDKYPTQIRVVSSDRFVMDNAKRMGATAISSQDYLLELKETVAPGPQSDNISQGKANGISAYEVKMWREIFDM